MCKWLVFNGALNRVAPASASAAAVGAAGEDESTATVGHVEQATVRRDTRRTDHRPALLAWAQDVTATHHTFLHIVLRASVLVPVSQQQVNPNQRCRLPCLPRAVLERLGDLLGVEMGRRVRNAREFAEALAVVMEEEKTRKKKKKKKKRKKKMMKDGAG